MDQKKRVRELRKSIKEGKEELTTLVESLKKPGSDVCGVLFTIMTVSNLMIESQTELNALVSDVDERKLLERSARRLKRKEREERKG